MEKKKHGGTMYDNRAASNQEVIIYKTKLYTFHFRDYKVV